MFGTRCTWLKLRPERDYYSNHKRTPNVDQCQKVQKIRRGETEQHWRYSFLDHIRSSGTFSFSNTRTKSPLNVFNKFHLTLGGFGDVLAILELTAWARRREERRVPVDLASWRSLISLAWQKAGTRDFMAICPSWFFSLFFCFPPRTTSAVFLFLLT